MKKIYIKALCKALELAGLIGIEINMIMLLVSFIRVGQIPLLTSIFFCVSAILSLINPLIKHIKAAHKREQQWRELTEQLYAEFTDEEIGQMLSSSKTLSL